MRNITLVHIKVCRTYVRFTGRESERAAMDVEVEASIHAKFKASVVRIHQNPYSRQSLPLSCQSNARKHAMYLAMRYRLPTSFLTAVQEGDSRHFQRRDHFLAGILCCTALDGFLVHSFVLFRDQSDGLCSMQLRSSP